MHIICPSCHTTFQIPLQKFGFISRRVKCSKCKSIWYHLFEEKDSLLDTNVLDSTNKDMNYQVSSTKKKNFDYISLNLALIFIIICLSVILLNQNAPFIKKESNIIIEKVRFSFYVEKNKINISYRILNTIDRKITIPMMKIYFLNKEKAILKSYTLEKRGFLLPANQHIDIDTKIIAMPIETNFIILKIGDRFDFIFQ